MQTRVSVMVTEIVVGRTVAADNVGLVDGEALVAVNGR